MDTEILLGPNSYIDNDKLPKLVDLIEEFSKQDLSKFWIDVGEKNVGVSINWKSIIMYDTTGNISVSKELEECSKHIVKYATNLTGLQRITINFLKGYSFMPIHVDGDDSKEYDTSINLSYNIIVPVTDHGQSIIDYKVIKNKKGYPLIFDGQIPHGAMNDKLETRITIYLQVDKKQFKNDSP